MTVKGLRTMINKQFVRIFMFCVRILYGFTRILYGFTRILYGFYTDFVRIYMDFYFSEKRIFKKTIWQHCSGLAPSYKKVYHTILKARTFIILIFFNFEFFDFCPARNGFLPTVRRCLLPAACFSGIQQLNC